MNQMDSENRSAEKPSAYEVLPDDLPPALALEREPRLRGLEHNAVFRIIQYRGGWPALGADLTYLPGLKWFFHPEARHHELSGGCPLPSEDMRELYLTHVTAQDFVIGIWGSMVTEGYSRIGNLLIRLFIVASLIWWVLSAFLGWGSGALFCVLLFALFLKEQTDNLATPYRDYRILANSMKFRLKSPLGQMLEVVIVLMKVIAIFLVYIFISVLFQLAMSSGGIPWPLSLPLFVRLLWDSFVHLSETIFKYIEFIANDPSPLVMIVRLIFGLLIYGLFYLWGRYECNKLVRRGAFDFEKTVQMMEIILQRWLRDHPFEGDKRRGTE